MPAQQVDAYLHELGQNREDCSQKGLKSNLHGLAQNREDCCQKGLKLYLPELVQNREDCSRKGLQSYLHEMAQNREDCSQKGLKLYLHELAQNREDCSHKRLEGRPRSVGCGCQGPQSRLLAVRDTAGNHFQQLGYEVLYVPLQLLRACTNGVSRV